jgi:hypothetical protein
VAAVSTPGSLRGVITAEDMAALAARNDRRRAEAITFLGAKWLCHTPRRRVTQPSTYQGGIQQ